MAENDETHPKPGSAADLVSKVDSAYGTHVEPGKPRFCEGNFNTARRLYNSLARRYHALKAVDPASTTRMIQSPLYVGCGKHVGRRIAAYDLVQTKTALQRANKLYGLTVSLLHYQGLTPKVHIITAVRTWQSGQLSRAEMLVAALAGSYDSLDGFNVREAGQTSDDLPLGSWLDHEVYVFSTMPHFRRNIDWSIADVDRLANIREFEKKMDKVQDGSLEQEADGAMEEIETLKARATRLDQRAAEVDNIMLAQAKCKAELQAETDRLTEISQLYDSLLALAE